MGIIRQLDDLTIKRIAAGEVIGRPGNALKELIENSIDSGATEITLHLFKGGLDKIIVIDNGCGMQKDDLEICTQIHTTSKTEIGDSSFGFSSLGFRGEALASIAAVSEICIESAFMGDANKIEISYGSQKKISKSSIQKGSRIEICNIFGNLPARMKFMKNEKLEWSFSKDIISRYFSSYQDIQWTIFHNTRKIWYFDVSSLQDRLLQIVEENPFWVKCQKKDCSIFGVCFEKPRNIQYIYVNKRPIKDRAIATFIKSIYSEYFPKNETPSYILFIEISPELVDYNVHPSKNEVRFLDSRMIYSLISDAFSNAFLNKRNNENIIFERDQSEAEVEVVNKVNNFSFFSNKASYQNSPKDMEEDVFSYKLPEIMNCFPNSDQKIMSYDNAALVQLEEPALYDENFDVLQYRIIGQIHSSFILFETSLGLGIFDQHAAHEREVYEKMKEALNSGESQRLLFPLELEISEEQKEILKNNAEIFEKKGIKIEFQEKILKITNSPSILSQGDLKKIFNSGLEENINWDIFFDRRLADVACKNALKAKHKLSLQQMESLLYKALKNPPVCNHGRPVFKYFKIAEIEYWFHRK